MSTADKVNDPEIREAVVKQVAQYILRGHAHTKNPPHTDAQILARARHDLAEMAGYGYVFHEGDEHQIAAEAQDLARDMQNHNVNWDQWAFGH